MKIKHEIIGKFPLVLIKWIDAESDSDWEGLSRVSTWADEHFVVQEVGWIICETKNYIVVCSQVTVKDDNFGNKTKIPRKWITYKQELTQVKSKK